MSSASAAAARRQHTLRGRPCKASLVSRGPSHQHTPLRPSCPRRCHAHHKGETGTKTLQSNSRAEQQQRAEKTAARQARLRARRPEPAPPHGVARELGLHGARRGPRRAPRGAVWRRGWFDHPPPLAVPRSAAARARGSAAAHASSRRERLESAQRSRPAWMFSSKASAPGEPAPSNVRHVVDQVSRQLLTRADARPAWLQSQCLWGRLLAGRRALCARLHRASATGGGTLATQRNGLASRMDAALSTVAGRGPLGRGGA